MTNDAQRIARLEQKVAQQQQQIDALQAAVAALQQNQFAQTGGFGGGGGGSNAYVCLPTGSVAAATWSSSAPTAWETFTADVWQTNGTSIVALGSRTCTNMGTTALVADCPCPCVQDEAGNFAVYSQYCAAVP
jgi:hypothetical protein